MSQKTEFEAEKQKLADLQAQLNGVQSEISDFEMELDKLDINDSKKAIGVIKACQEAISARELMTERLRLEIKKAEQAVEGAHKKAQEESAVELRKIEAAAYREVVNKILALEQAVKALENVHSRLHVECDVYPKYHLPFGISKASLQALNELRVRDPEAIGLPAKPSPHEVRLREGQILVARMKDRVRYLSELYKTEKKADIENALETASYDLKLAEDRLQVLR